ncbi:pirin family protein [Pontibacter cellulosilyticus]|uniref:Pirin family protein n=1 Tax=Pontibacter cellulosilyticus TaxID=1720253 RepID=A0A923N503_9BACT|nr:pirin family protein [Pontibacter cellulosilyticus]MBC5992328.1 pirin family protein [Pontibacter cellulosilyticus]
MKARTVNRILYADMVDMGGMPVRQPFPTQQVEQLDPFLLLHHHVAKLPEGTVPKQSGVGPHPHRGFSPVTFVYKGGVHHRDSRGNDSVVYEGGTQWMNAGLGIIHSERPPEDIEERGGVQEIIQLWVNLPKSHKMQQPEYIALQAEDTPQLELEGGKISVSVVAGEFQDTRGPIKTAVPILSLRIFMQAGSSYTFPIPETHSAFLYLLDGQVSYEGFGLVEWHHVVVLNNDGSSFSLKAKEDTRILLMAGEPIKEPVVSHGPFVMNTQTEILQAMRDYQMGKMGFYTE